MPQVSRQDLDNSSAVITVTVNKEELQPAVERELKKFKNRAALKGFRQGHAPMAYVKRMFGTAILNDVMNDIFSKGLHEYLEKSGLDVLGQPLPSADQPQYAFKIDNLEPEYAVRYDIGFVPPFEIAGLDKNETYEIFTISNLDDLAEEDLKYIVDKSAKQEESEEPIVENDIVRIQAVELDGDAPKEDGWETFMMFNVNDIPDEETKTRILGMKKGDTLRFEPRKLDRFGENDEPKYRKYILSIPDGDDREVGDYFEGEISTMIRHIKPALDEAFFSKQFGETVTDREGALEKIREGVRAFYTARAHALLARDMQKRLMEKTRIELPEAFLERWLTETNRDKLSPEQIANELPAFLEGLRWSLISGRIREGLDLFVSEEEILEVYARRIRSYFQSKVDDDLVYSLAERFMKEDQQRKNVIDELENDKMFAAMREMVTLVDKPVLSEEFHKLVEEAQ